MTPVSMSNLRIDGNKLYIKREDLLPFSFGGGYPFSHLSGVNLPKAIVEWVKGNKETDDLLIEKTGVLAQKDINMIDISNLK